MGFVGRLDLQKGVDVVLSAAPQLLGPPSGSTPAREAAPLRKSGLQLVVLGAGGEAWMERGLEGLGRSFPGRAAGLAVFDEPAAHLVIAASDYLVGRLKPLINRRRRSSGLRAKERARES